MPSANKEYKDRLFSFLFGREENKVWTLKLYNAINNSNYDNANDVQIKTIREVLYLRMHNDVSFLIADVINMYEQQSSYNPNMPLRQMQYTGNIYEKYLKENHLNKYGSTLLRLPVPKLIVFYNGRDDQPDESHRSDVFGMLLTEYDEVENLKLFKEDGRREGREESLIDSIKNLMKNLSMTADQAMTVLNIPSAERPKLFSKL